MGPSPLSFSAITQDNVADVGRRKLNGNFDLLRNYTVELTTGFTTNILSATTINGESVTYDSGTITSLSGTSANFTTAILSSITTTNFTTSNISSNTLDANQFTFTGATGTSLNVSALTSTDATVGTFQYTNATGTSLTISDLNSSSRITGNEGVLTSLSATTAEMDAVLISGQTLETIFSNFDYKTTTWADLKSEYNSSGLTKGAYYLVSDRDPEPLVLFASESHRIGTQAWSLLHPTDIIHVDLDTSQSVAGIDGYIETIPTPSPSYDDQGVKIVYRRNTVNNIEAYYDWRYVRFRRWLATGITNTETNIGYIAWSTSLSNNDIGSSDTEIDVDNGSTQDLYTFGSVDPSNVKNVSIGKHSTKDLNNIIFLTGGDVENVKIDYDCHNMTFSGAVKNTTIGSISSGNIIGRNFEENTTRQGFSNNMIFTSVKRNVFGNDFKFNSVGENSVENTFGATSQYNTLGKEFQNNHIGDRLNTTRFGDTSKENNIGDYFDNNECGVNYTRNFVGNKVRNTVFGTNFTGATLGDNQYQNNFGNDIGLAYIGDLVTNCTIGSGATGTRILGSASNITIATNSQYNTIGEFSSSVSIDGNSDYNSVGRGSTGNAIGSNSDWNKIGDDADSNTIGDSCSHNLIGDASNSNTINDSSERNELGYKTISNDIGSGSLGCLIGDRGQSNNIGAGSVEVELVRDCRDVNFGSNSKYVEVYHNYDQKTSTILYDIDYGSSTVQFKRFDLGFSNFEDTFNVAAAGTDINISSFGKYGYLGVINIESVSTGMTKTDIVGAPTKHEFVIKPVFGQGSFLELTLQGASPTTTTSGKFVLDSSPVTLDSRRGDFIVFEADSNGVLREQYRQIN